MKHLKPVYLTAIVSLFANLSLTAEPKLSRDTEGGEAPVATKNAHPEKPPLKIASTSLSLVAKNGTPRFSWQITPQGRAQNQTAYQIKVFTRGDKVVWDSGKVTSTESAFIPYEGEKLSPQDPARNFQWQVKIWNDSDIAGDWSTTSSLSLQTAPGDGKVTPLSHFESSDERLNKVYQSTIAHQRETFRKTPAFAPDNLPWGDSIQITARGNALVSNLSDTYLSWTQSAVDNQDSKGLFSAMPSLPGQSIPAAGYSDSAVIVPFTLWQQTQDTTFLDYAFEPAVAYLSQRQKQDPEFAGKPFGTHLGDRGHLDDPTSQEFLSLAYFGLDCRLVSEMAKAMNHPPYLLQHSSWFIKAQAGFAKNFLNDEGLLLEQSQTAHLLALRFGLLPPDSKQPTIDALVSNLQINGVKSGNLGIGALLPVLAWTGNNTLAAELVRDFGKEQGVTKSAKLAAASDWMVSFLAGINHQLPGFKVSRICPYLPADGSVTRVKASHKTPYGRIVSEWEVKDQSKSFKVTIPPNTSGIISLPAEPDATVTESGRALEEAPGCQFMQERAGRKEILLRSGSYHFLVQ